MNPIRFGKYQVIEKLGQGGFGVVYLGRDPDLKRLVAIKTCSSGDRHFQERFFREAEIAAGLQHPNVVTVFDLGEQDDGTPYMVQELLTGEDLSEVIARRGAPSVATRLRYLLEIAAGLRYAHSRSVIHRDIKPSNVRVLDDGRVKILDFGIAKLLRADHALTRTGTALGSMGYLAPEQVEGRTVDQRADIFSFGCLAYELLTGQQPFGDDDTSAVLNRLLHQEPAPIEELWPECPPALAECIVRCLRKDPAERYQDLGQVIAELEPIAADTSITGEVPEAARASRIPRGAPGQAPANSAFLTAIRLRRVTLGWTAVAIAAVALLVLAVWSLLTIGDGEEPTGESAVFAETGAGEGGAGGRQWPGMDGAAQRRQPAADLGRREEVASGGEESGAAGRAATPHRDLGAAGDAGTAPALAPADETMAARRVGTSASEDRRPLGPAPVAGSGSGNRLPPDSQPPPPPRTAGDALWIVVHGDSDADPGTTAAAMASALAAAGVAVAGTRQAPSASFGELPAATTLPPNVGVVVVAHLRTQVEPSLGRFFTGRAHLDLQTYDAVGARLLGGESLEVGGGGRRAELAPTELAARAAAAREAGRLAAGAVLEHLGRD